MSHETWGRISSIIRKQQQVQQQKDFISSSSLSLTHEVFTLSFYFQTLIDAHIKSMFTVFLEVSSSLTSLFLFIMIAVIHVLWSVDHDFLFQSCYVFVVILFNLLQFMILVIEFYAAEGLEHNKTWDQNKGLKEK